MIIRLPSLKDWTAICMVPSFRWRSLRKIILNDTPGMAWFDFVFRGSLVSCLGDWGRIGGVMKSKVENLSEKRLDSVSE
jgi:hypothetical protein